MAIIPVYLLALIFFLGNAVALILWLSPAAVIISKPGTFSQIFPMLLSMPTLTTLYLYYDNVMLFLRLITAVGLFRRRPWAYRLVFVIVIVTLLEVFISILTSVRTLTSHDLGRACGASFFGIAVWVIFKTRAVKSIFGLDEETPETPSAPPMQEGKLKPAVLNSLADEAEGAPWYSNLDKTENMVIYMGIFAGLAFSYQFKLGIMENGIFGGVWAFFCYMTGFYLFRSEKIPMLAGGLAAAGIYYAALTFMAMPALPAGIACCFLGGITAGALAKRDRPFQASSAGFLWACIQVGFALKAGKWFGTKPDKIDFNALRSIAGIASIYYIQGILPACAAGFLVQIVKNFTKKPPAGAS